MNEIDLKSRKVYRGGWSLLAQWYCIPVDMTAEEEVAFLEMAREDITFDRYGCPPEYIRDRMFGGFICGNDSDRRHVMFNAGTYSYIEARKGKFWPMSLDERAATFEKLLKENAKQPVPDPLEPFCEGRPA